jgi:hypothetical protein
MVTPSQLINELRDDTFLQQQQSLLQAFELLMTSGNNAEALVILDLISNKQEIQSLKTFYIKKRLAELNEESESKRLKMPPLDDYQIKQFEKQTGAFDFDAAVAKEEQYAWSGTPGYAGDPPGTVGGSDF